MQLKLNWSSQRDEIHFKQCCNLFWLHSVKNTANQRPFFTFFFFHFDGLFEWFSVLHFLIVLHYKCCFKPLELEIVVLLFRKYEIFRLLYFLMVCEYLSMFYVGTALLKAKKWYWFMISELELVWDRYMQVISDIYLNRGNG